MRIEDFDYKLPHELIASVPLPDRSASRMLHVDRRSASIRDEEFVDLPAILCRGDVLVLNNTRVFPARLFGKTGTGAAIELLLKEEIEDSIWSALAKPAKRLKSGTRIDISENLTGEILERQASGSVLIRFDSQEDLWNIFESVGNVPLPHYIKRTGGESIDDRERYQTVYAKQPGAIAAPTAGLHFTSEVLNRLEKAGIQTLEVTLHVGYGTFEPVRVDELADHRVLPERFEITERTSDALNVARKEGCRIIAVGTTTTRALESAVDVDGFFRPQKSRTSLTVVPGNRFHAIDALLTNFHLPKSSLLILVSAFGGHQLIMDSYRHAVTSKYRFYSYGDCMFIE